MIGFWKLLKFLPPQVQTAIKRYTSARLRIWMREKFGASPTTIPDRIATVPDGRRFHIGPDWIYWAIHLGMEFEPDPTAVVRVLVRDGDTSVDVGANFGWYTSLCAIAAGPTGHVFAFEPVPSTFDRLTENLQLNRLQNRVTAVRSAVGEKPGVVEVYIFDHLSHSRASLSPLDEPKYRTVKAPLIDLDTFLSQQQVERVDFLKCDVEGSELSVLKGCKRFLDSASAPIVLIETNADTSRAFGYGEDDIWHYLREAGYDHFYQIGASRNLRRVSEAEEARKLDLLLAGKGNVVEQRVFAGDG